jgi:hypothetical protein
MTHRMATVVALGALLLAPAAWADHDNGKGAGHGGQQQEQGDAGDNRHPSGRDRSVEPGGSGTQGKSASDPDGTSNGGADKPGGPGGMDLGDQDGNNGCGNDDDFEDDNNGNCGGPAEAGPDVAGEDTGRDSGVPDAELPDVEGSDTVRDTDSGLPADVLGVKLTRPAVVPDVLGTDLRAGGLPMTGVPVDGLVAAAAALLVTGAGCQAAGRRRYRSAR